MLLQLSSLRTGKNRMFEWKMYENGYNENVMFQWYEKLFWGISKYKLP